MSPAAGNIAFALDLYGQLKNSTGNIFFSPYSISTCLAMTYAGARGDTEKQMAEVLHFSRDQKQLHASFERLREQLEAGKQEGIELNIANALWTQAGYPFRRAFIEMVARKYQANLNQANFLMEAEAARQEINQWVRERTQEKINEILPPSSVGPLTRLILANAIYFKGLWAKPFEESATSTEPFHLSSTRKTPVPLMHHFDEVKYMEESEFQVVELPYKGYGLSMVLFLPRELHLSRMEDRLNESLLSRSLAQLRKREVEIFLPRFKLEFGLELQDTLAGMGMPDAFREGKADFSGMTKTNELWISGIYHKAWGEVNEEGTEATAATIVDMVGCISMTSPPPPPVFRADHPFIFLIRDVHTGTILFLGRLTNPEI